MRNLLFTSLLLMGASLSAQTVSSSFAEMNRINRNVINTECSVSTQAKSLNLIKPARNLRSLASKKADVESRMKDLARVADENVYIAQCSGALFSSDPMLWNPAITTSGTTVTIKSVLPYTGIADITGTVGGNLVTVSGDQEVMDLILTDASGAENSVKGVFMEVSGMTGVPTTNITFAIDEAGRYVWQPEADMNFLAIGVKVQGGYAFLEGFTDYKIVPSDAFTPYYSCLAGLWNYGMSLDGGYSLVSPSACASSEFGMVMWLDMATYFSAVGWPAYTLDWSYYVDDELVSDPLIYNDPTSSSIRDICVMEVPATATQLSYPTVEATCGANTMTYSVSRNYNGQEFPGVIYVDAPSEMTADNETTDYGFGLWNNKGGAFPIYGTSSNNGWPSTLYLSETESADITSVGTVYQSVAPITFGSLGVCAWFPESTVGKQITATLYRTETDGTGELILLGKPFATSTITLQPNVNYLVLTGDEASGYVAMVEFADFEGYDEAGFTSPVETVNTGENFILLLSGVEGTEFGLATDAASDYVAAFMGLNNNTVLTDGENLYTGSAGVNLAIFFYAPEEGSGISTTTINNQNINVINNGTDFVLSYAEGIRGVQVVNVAGQVVADYALDGTSATIPASALAKGLYILKFDNGQTVKVMK